MAICLVMILWASILVVQPMVASSSIYFFVVASLVGLREMVIFVRVCSCWISRWFG